MLYKINPEMSFVAGAYLIGKKFIRIYDQPGHYTERPPGY